MILKYYQEKALSVLRDYLEKCRILGTSEAYKEVTQNPEQKKRLGRYAQSYRPLNGLENTPYICLRLPTGGGKTILASRSISIARDAWLEKDYPTVLWLVPSNTIRQQTVEALKNPKHPYRMQMDEQFEGRVRVFDISDFTQVRPQDVENNLTVIVGTIQTLRVSNTEGRKVYAHNEHLEPHFTSVSDTTPGLEKINGSNKIKYSFANLLHLLHPIMIVDEAHNAVTGLSQEMQERVSPSCIIEFTATPRLNSNILHNSTAQELKDEEMIKLPVVLAEHPNWQSAVDGAIQRRQELSKVAESDPSYIRPIVLFQAQKKNEEVTVDVLKKYLIDTNNIDESKIAIATGEQRELDGINLFEPKCPIEFVITVEALKEGWDCSFAYVFCSVARIQNATAVEQLLGRVLRMPFAQKRNSPELNRAYAHVSEPSFSDAANALKDKLVGMGFDEAEAALNIEHELRSEEELPLDFGMFGQPVKPKPTLVETIDATPDLEALSESDKQAISIEETDSGEFELTVTGHVSDEAIAVITQAVPETKKKTFTEKVATFKQRIEKELSPAAKGVPFVMPKLVSHIQGEMEFADPEIFDECHDWSLLDHPAQLDEAEFTIRDEANTFEIDLDGRTLAISYASKEEQLSLDIDVDNWTENGLAMALDKLITDPRFGQGERVKWCLNHVHHLVHDRSIPISALWRAKFVLGRKLVEKIKALKVLEAGKAYQEFLFAPEAKPDITFDDAFEFYDGMYDGQKPHRGNFKLKKHYLELVPEIDGGEKGEEFQCAVALERINEVKHWLRNVSRHPASFRLPLATNWTYPDFVAELEDGRLLVVEYKGEHWLNDPETKEKKLIGELWEKQMNSKGIYIMAIKEKDGKDVYEQIVERISSGN